MTGYTAELCEKGQSFRDFLFTCARATGACIALRDEPLTAELPDEVGFGMSAYYAKTIAEKRAELSRLTAIPVAKRAACGQEMKAAAIASMRSLLEKEQLQNARVLHMRAEVQAWAPPSPDHAGFKTFMLQQLELSLDGTGYYSRKLEELEAKAPTSFYTEAVAAARRDLYYYEEEANKDAERDRQRNEWVRQLKASVPAAPAASAAVKGGSL